MLFNTHTQISVFTNHQAQNMLTRTQGKEKEHKHIQSALKTCSYPNQAFVKSRKRSCRSTSITEREDKNNKRNKTGIPYVECLKSKHSICVGFEPSNTLRQKLYVVYEIR